MLGSVLPKLRILDPHCWCHVFIMLSRVSRSIGWSRFNIRVGYVSYPRIKISGKKYFLSSLWQPCYWLLGWLAGFLLAVWSSWGEWRSKDSSCRDGNEVITELDNTHTHREAHKLRHTVVDTQRQTLTEVDTKRHTLIQVDTQMHTLIEVDKQKHTLREVDIQINRSR
jgi:hypothetical protein